MRKKNASLEWHFIENDAEWEHQRALLLPDVAPAISHRLHLKRYLWPMVVLLLLLAGTSQWWQRSTQVSLHATMPRDPLVVVTPGLDSLVASIMNEQVSADWWRQHSDIMVQTVEILDEQALVSIVTSAKNGTSLYRQTRFYRRTTEGWQQAAPDARLWGPAHRLETPYFVYHFREKDAAAVLAVAPQMDALYTTLGRNFGLPIVPTAEKWRIDVNVTQPTGQVTMFDASNHFRVSSPVLYFAPLELTDAELLKQSLALPLLTYALAQARTYHAIGLSWQPMWSGLYLWQLWDLDLPLSTWREAVVKWLYVDVRVTQPRQPIVLPGDYRELCATHKLWLASPLQINIPLVCTELDEEGWFFAVQEQRNPLTRLNQLAVAVLPNEDTADPGYLLRMHHLSQTVAVATLIEYAVATYGHERLPALVAGLGQYDSWELLLPAVFGVSATEFEVGWQAYLTVHYGLSAAHESGT